MAATGVLRGLRSARTGKTGKARRAARSSAVDIGARWGLAARGVLYVLIGILALRIALGDDGGSGNEADSSGAVRELARQPWGEVLVWAVGIGLVGLAVWRFTEAVFGASGPDGAKPGKRALSAVRCVFYGFMAVSVLSFVIASKGGSGSDATSQDLTARALELPLGRWLVGFAGLVVMGIGVGVGVRAARRTFRKHLEKAKLPRGLDRTVDVLGVVGGLARGLIYTAAGVFVVSAALHYDPDEAKGMDGALRSLARTPAGPWLLILVAGGLVLFGLFSCLLARCRRV
ncbi:DUF1206 domain-containing protein [Streptomyces sp. NPDC050095]|uniref:DUF1206 domain-containing protein n=1 Tax=unclassified Streptomyces TaxID=2593676 RepID=UPI003445CBDC